LNWILLLIALGALVALYVAADRARTIAVVEMERGKARVVRGKLPAKVLAEIRDVAERNRLTGTVTIRRESGAVRVDLSGIDDPRATQQLRNVIGRFRLAELRP
jgi:hypothetical protein